MKYELHVTVSEDTDTIEFLKWCYEWKRKPILILLDKGDNKVQQMFTETAVLSQDSFAKTWADQVVKSTSWDVVRCKLESDELYGPCEYYEQHTKFAINPGPQTGYGLSTNLLNNKWFLTSRANLCHALDAGHVASMDSERERVIIDSNKDLDKGWL